MSRRFFASIAQLPIYVDFVILDKGVVVSELLIR